MVTQRFGQGRSMVFAGEASWRWRMLLPASDTTHELVWRQLARWVASGAAERIEIPAASAALPGTTEDIAVLVRNEQFYPVGNADGVASALPNPVGSERTMTAALADPTAGKYTAAVRFEQPGVYSIAADVRRGSEVLGTASRALLVGGVDVELAQPRLNESLLRRIADTTRREYVPAGDAGKLRSLSEPDRGGEVRRPRCATSGTTDSASQP